MGGVTTETRAHAPRLSAVLREGERVTPLELFFDLVFVLAITQCTALMSAPADLGRAGRRACWCSACCGGRGSATRG